jgi:hypothetical protein
VEIKTILICQFKTSNQREKEMGIKIKISVGGSRRAERLDEEYN